MKKMMKKINHFFKKELKEQEHIHLKNIKNIIGKNGYQQQKQKIIC